MRLEAGRVRTIICKSNSGSNHRVNATTPERCMNSLPRFKPPQHDFSTFPRQNQQDDVVQAELIDISLVEEAEDSVSPDSTLDEMASITDDSDLIEDLTEAAKSGDLTLFRRACARALRCHFRLDSPGYMGWTAAHWAAREGHVDILEHLTSLRANLDSIDRKGDTLLHKAAANGQHLACQWLLERGFNARTRNNNAFTPLDLAQEHIAISGRNRAALQCEKILSAAYSNTF